MFKVNYSSHGPFQDFKPAILNILYTIQFSLLYIQLKIYDLQLTRVFNNYEHLIQTYKTSHIKYKRSIPHQMRTKHSTQDTHKTYHTRFTQNVILHHVPTKYITPDTQKT